MRRAGRCLCGQRIAFATLAKGLYDDSFEDSTGCLSWAIRRSIYLEAGFRQRRPLVEDAQSVGYVVGISFGQPRFGYGPGADQLDHQPLHVLGMSEYLLHPFRTPKV